MNANNNLRQPVSRTKKPVEMRASLYYDGGLARIDDFEIPSKRVGYKNENGVLVARIPIGVMGFEAAIRDAFGEYTKSGWPLKGRLLVAINLQMPKSSYLSKDVDNMAKSILDAFKGIAFEDDRQVDSLFVAKSIGENWRVWVGFKSIGDSPRNWFVEPLMERIR